MKGNQRVVEFLNKAVLAETAAIDQYVINAAIYDNFGFGDLAKRAMKTAHEEMGHLHRFIDRILFLGGAVKSGQMDAVFIGKDPDIQINNDLDGEYRAVTLYNEAITVCTEVGDAGTKKLFEKILKDEERHSNYWETQKTLIKRIGLQNYLVEQVG